MIYDINYKNKQYHSKEGFELISDKEFEDIKTLWYSKPKKELVEQEIASLKYGGVKFSECTDYYFRDLMDNTVKYFDKWSINDVINNKELLSIFVNKVKKNPNVFSSDSIIENIDTAFRLGGKGIASKVSQFPIKTIDYILYEYNVNGNYYDYSCGWGARLCGALKNNLNYFGTDPNYLLVDRLKIFSNDFKGQMRTNSGVDIRCQGSEHFVPEWENTIGVAFSSPPYFLLEDYKIGDQSYKSGITTYQEWLNNYLQPTINNIYRYLVNDGYFICNIKDFDKYELEKDTIKCAEKAGFELYETKTLEQASRVSGNVANDNTILVDVDEKVYVFIKKGATPKICHPVQLTLFDLF